MARAVQIRRGRRHAGGAPPCYDSPTCFPVITYVKVPSYRITMYQTAAPGGEQGREGLLEGWWGLGNPDLCPWGLERLLFDQVLQ